MAETPDPPGGDAEAVAPQRRRVPTWALALVGVGVGAVLGVGASVLLRDDDAPSVELQPVESPYPEDQQANAAAFLDAWERYRRATFRAEMTFTRAVPDGRQFELHRVIVQQPPRRVVRQLDSVTAVEDDDTLVCAARGDDQVCSSVGGSDYDTAVARELAVWRTAITGDAPVYAVESHEDGCFELRLVTAIPVPPYGNATFACFDEATGALVSRQVIRATGTDTEEATAISAEVTDADWQTVTG